MLANFASSWGQTVAALLVLALAGGWALWPFRRDDRPFFYLAAPLAGLILLGFALSVLYCVAKLSVQAALPVAMGVLAVPTIYLLWRRRPFTPPPGWRLALV